MIHVLIDFDFYTEENYEYLLTLTPNLRYHTIKKNMKSMYDEFVAVSQKYDVEVVNHDYCYFSFRLTIENFNKILILPFNKYFDIDPLTDNVYPDNIWGMKDDEDELYTTNEELLNLSFANRLYRITYLYYHDDYEIENYVHHFQLSPSPKYHSVVAKSKKKAFEDFINGLKLRVLDARRNTYFKEDYDANLIKHKKIYRIVNVELENNTLKTAFIESVPKNFKYRFPLKPFRELLREKLDESTRYISEVPPF